MSIHTMLDNPDIRQSIKRLSVDEYHRLSEAAIIAENTELLQGILIEQMTKSPLHTWIVRQLVDWLRAAVPPNYDVRQEQPITLDDSEPEPDVAIVAGRPVDYRSSHPRTAEVIMEVAIATVALDMEKAFPYAVGNVNEYWLVLPVERRVDVYTAPSPTGYQRKESFTSPTSIALKQFPQIKIDLEQLFRE